MDIESSDIGTTVPRDILIEIIKLVDFNPNDCFKMMLVGKSWSEYVLTYANESLTSDAFLLRFSENGTN